MLEKRKWGGLALAALVAVASMTAFVPAPASAQAFCTESAEIKYGSSRSDCVRYIQQMINGIGNTKRWYGWEWLSEDGSFGSRTDKQVRGFQATAHTTPGHNSLMVDGQVGPKTWSELCRYVHDFWIGNGGEFKEYRIYSNIIRDRYWVANIALSAANDAGCHKYDSWYSTF